jgi:hypothetical protein
MSAAIVSGAGGAIGSAVACRHVAQAIPVIVVWLQSPEASFATGTAHAVDGAFTTA